MSWLDALIMGIVQGLAEYLPISSSGHLEICRDILGLDLNGAEALEFDVALHVATVLSTIVVLWKEFMPLCISFFTLKFDSRFTYVCKILVSCIPVAIVGLCFKDVVESFFGNGLTVVGICLIITAALLSFAYFFRTRGEKSTSVPKVSDGKADESITWIDAIAMGIAQAIAVLPGLSRSGSTIATGISMGANRAAVARFSFFMVIIPILGEALLGLKDIVSGESATAGTVGAVPLTIGFLASFIVGCAACKWMIEIVKKGKLVWFAIYCLAAGLLCILW
ncbi:MAG: undecaprenyl-diphosphate phosphatase [Paramuribaculum sp.]|nr:undecaprenyl-diphosphate phosphatase [Paramuribaculum sp.]